MPRSVRVPPVYLHRPKGLARVRIEGRDFYLGPFRSEEAEENYRRIIAEWLSTGVLPEPIRKHREPTLFTINQLVLAYWKHAEVWYQKDGSPNARAVDPQDAGEGSEAALRLDAGG